MRRHPSIFSLLSKDPNPAADAALLAALPGADGATAESIIQTLLERDQKTGLSGLIGVFHELNESLQQRILASIDRLVPLLREAFQSRNERMRLNTLELIRRGGLFRASYLLESAMHDPSAEVFAAAVATLHDLAGRLVSTHEEYDLPSPRADSGDGEFQAANSGLTELRHQMMELQARRDDRKHVASALFAGLSSTRLHLQPKLIEAAMWLVEDLGMRLWTVLATPGGKVMRLAASVFDDADKTRLIPFAMSAIQRSEFRPFVLRALSTCTDADFWEEWCRQGWRTRAPGVARNLSAIRDAACTGEHSGLLLSLSPEAQRHATSWIALSGMALETRLTMLRELQRRGAPAARKAALWTLCAIPDARATTLLAVIAADAAPEAARSARFELARRQPKQYRPKELLAAVRKLSNAVSEPETEEHKPLTFEDYWSSYDLLSEHERIIKGHEMLLANPGAESHLRRLLTCDDASQRVRALRVATLLGRTTSFAQQIYSLVHDSESEVRSAAVTALGKLGDATSRLLLHGALLDPDTRVQANAVEAVDGLREHFDPGELLPKLASSDNRVRANAVAALLKLGIREAAETLLQMLQDASRAHRISALWLLEHMGVAALAGRVLRLAETDADAEVRERAAKLAARLKAAEAEVPA